VVEPWEWREIGRKVKSSLGCGILTASQPVVQNVIKGRKNGTQPKIVSNKFFDLHLDRTRLQVCDVVPETAGMSEVSAGG